MLLLGVPLVDLWRFWLLIVACLALLFLPLRALSLRAAGVLAGGVLLLGAVAQSLPRPAIEEGHQAFLLQGPGEYLERHLPPEVFAVLKQEFDQAYPADKRCDPQLAGCWRQSPVPDRLYAFSADNLWGTARYSRRVDRVEFTSLMELRAGFVNELAYNFYPKIYADDQQRSEIARPNLPYYLMLEWNARMVGAQLCWTGDVLWETAAGRYTRLFHELPGCREITADDVGRHVYGLSVSSEVARRLTMQLALPPSLQWAGWARAGLTVLALCWLLGWTLRWRWQPLVIPAAGLTIATIATYDAAVNFYGDFIIYQGGNDGLLHEGYARNMLRHLLAGNIAELLRGGEDVYYYMPGLRYLKVLERVLFGDNHFGLLAVMLFAPMAVYAAARRVMPMLLALGLMVALYPLGVYTIFIDLAARGFGDSIGYVLFLIGAALLLHHAANREAALGSSVTGHLLLALASFVRPNLLPGAGLLLLAVFFWNVRQRRWPTAVAAAAGFIPVLVMPLHNWWFGQKWVLLTAAANIKENLKMPPATYAEALQEVLDGRFNGPSLQLIHDHLPWFHAYWPAKLGMLAITLLALIVSWRRRPSLTAYAWAAVGLNGVFLFYDPDLRYSLLAWLMVLIVNLGMLVWGIELLAGARFRQLQDSLLALLPRRHDAGIK